MNQSKNLNLANNLADIEIFSELGSVDQNNIKTLCLEKYFQVGDTIIDQMSNTQGVYFISKAAFVS